MTKKERRLLLSVGVILVLLLVQFAGGDRLLEHFSTQTEPEVRGVSEEQAVVTRVVDGDTIVVSVGAEELTVRLIGINTPETVDPRRPVECFGKEASAYAKELLTGKTVRLQDDPTQQNRDRYNRLLRYVFLEGGTNVNGLMIQQGYAYEYTYDTPYQLQEDFISAQKQAEVSGIGLWSDEACSER
jgi:micrococcal nuclease